jgi:hypothetical protein
MSLGTILLGVFAVMAPCVSLCACGPSFQAVYEGNSRFEHCYALEENPQIAMPDKATCWRDWSEHYTYGQTRDRVQYATARYVALSQSTNLPTDEAMMMAAPGETGRVTTIMAPAPTNAFAPPPKVLEEGDLKVTKTGHPGEAINVPVIAIDAGPPVPPPAPLPLAICGDGCANKYRDCSGACEDADAGPASAKTAKSCQACRKTYRTCMRDCFK